MNQGRGRGVATYFTKEFKVSGLINSRSYQMLKVSSEEYDVINIYRSQDANTGNFLKDLGGLVKGARPTFIVGDLNINYLQEPKAAIVSKILSNGFKQIVIHPTHVGGGLIDHVYARRLAFEPATMVSFPYYSDHGAVSIFQA